MSNDHLLDLCVQRAQASPSQDPSCDKHYLVIADENTLSSLDVLQQLGDNTQVYTNRFDVHQHCQNIGLKCVFNDYKFDDYIFDGTNPETQLDSIIFRISKERGTSHYVLNWAKKLLPAGGELIIAGKKNEGIKSYYSNAVKVLGFSGKIEKHKDNYVVILRAPSSESEKTLDDKNYASTQETVNVNGLSCQSKPGIYGWNKLDQGSQLLAEHFKACLAKNRKQNTDTTKLLDIGCGYGYLSIIAAQANIKHIVATDNNAAAVSHCQTNLERLQAQLKTQAPDDDSVPFEFEVSADDCGQNIDQKFNWILCNPPFHQGFDTSKALTEKFVASAKRLLSRSGTALFVVNSFIPIETVAHAHFSQVTMLENTGQFKIIQLNHPLQSARKK
ncbi:MAG: RNA methyltransferase RsmC [Alteromonadaceae bacterium]|nr:MAG: RNA methyltransferase RsmC [Alteromonadaceae bacterium]